MVRTVGGSVRGSSFLAPDAIATVKGEAIWPKKVWKLGHITKNIRFLNVDNSKCKRK